MRKIKGVLMHINVVLGLMFLVFLVLDIYNPMMNFIDNDISRALLVAFCVSAILQSVLGWLVSPKRRIMTKASKKM